MKKKYIHTEIIHLIKLTIRLLKFILRLYNTHNYIPILSSSLHNYPPLERNANHVMMHVGLFGLI